MTADDIYPINFPGRLAVQQRVLPAYRALFFDLLTGFCTGGLSVFAGLPGPEESINSANVLQQAEYIKSSNWNPLPASNPFYILWQKGIGAWLKSFQPDVLIVEANSRYLSNRYAVHWMHARRRPVIGWGLGVPTLEGSSPFAALRRWERTSYLRSLDGVISYSQRGADQYREIGIPGERIWVAPNAAARRPPGIPPARSMEQPDKPTILFVGRLQARKRIDNLLHACASLPLFIRPRLVIVGDGPARHDFEDLASSVFPEAQFTGEKHGKELESLFLEADLFVLPGTGGLAVQQAMSYALPVIVAEGDGTQNDLVRPENGLRIASGDLQALKDALQFVLSDFSRLRQMGAASYRIVTEEVNLEKMVEVFIRAACTVRGNP